MIAWFESSPWMLFSCRPTKWPVIISLPKRIPDEFAADDWMLPVARVVIRDRGR